MNDKSGEQQNKLNIDDELVELRKRYDAEIKHYKVLLAKKEQFHSQQLSMLEKSLKESWTWRIGNLFTGTTVMIINLIKNPAKFYRDSLFRRSVNRNANNIPSKNRIDDSITTKPDQSKIKTNSILGLKDKVPMLPVVRIDNKPVIAAVMDEFTTACFDPECTLITFRPDNWEDKVSQQSPEAIFVESAWNGNQGSWQYKIAKYHRNMGDELDELVSWAKSYHIPTIFWNKEDPPNFDRFIEKAKLFDYIFTTDEDCISKYREHIQHNNVYALPFAAQPELHNPINDLKRAYNVCFAGTYHADEYHERQNDMEILLNPAMKYDLHIYDRNYGTVGPGTERFRFPEKYQPFIKGRLNYNDMVKAYHQYKVFLNVNSVKNSPTMFSRRVFELLASGTPVISTYSKGIVELLGDSVFITESESDTYKHLDMLLNDQRAWLKASVKGIRKVMESHTYNQRLKVILDLVGIPLSHHNEVEISVIMMIHADEDLNRIANILLQQTLKPKHLILLVDNLPNADHLTHLNNKLDMVKVTVLNRLVRNLMENLRLNATGDYFAIWNPVDFYGPDYLKDFSLAIQYSAAEYISKSNYYSLQNGQIVESNQDLSFCRTRQAPIFTLMVKKTHLKSVIPLLVKSSTEVFNMEKEEIISLDPLNYIKNVDGVPELDHRISQDYFG